MRTRLILLLLAAAACSAFAAGQAQATVRVLVPQTTAALPFLAMADSQPVAGAELSVSFFSNHAQALALLLRGDADLLLSGTSQGWENRLDGSPILMLDTGAWGISALVGKDASLKGFADLKGKRIAMPFPGSPLDFQSRALLAFEKLDPDKDVTISYGPFPQSIQRLLSGQLDAVAVPEPVATTIVKQNNLLRIVDYADAWGRLTGGDRMSPQVSLFATESWAGSHKALISSLVTAWDAATKALNAAPDGATKYAQALAVDPAILQEALTHTRLSVPTPADNRARVLAYYQVVSKYFPAARKPLDDRFFLVP